MKIENAYIVIIDFDGDIASKVVRIHVFTTLKEVMDIVRQALIDMNNHYRTKYKTSQVCYIDNYEISIEAVNDEIYQYTWDDDDIDNYLYTNNFICKTEKRSRKTS